LSRAASRCSAVCVDVVCVDVVVDVVAAAVLWAKAAGPTSVMAANVNAMQSVVFMASFHQVEVFEAGRDAAAASC
jgi:hypothetical protein